MKTNVTGANKLSKKLLAILILAGISTMVQGADNSIFIDQAGSNSSITINQDGAGNKVGGLLKLVQIKQ